jgi:dihydrofolate reductase
MRKVILQNFVTLDGFAADSSGEIDFIVADRSVDEDFLRSADAIDTILLGRETYSMFSQYWPTVTTETELVADFVNTTPKIVFSRTLDRAPWGTWDEAHIAGGAAPEEVAKLKAQPGKDMILWGSLSLGHALIKAGLIDEYQLRVCPRVLGEGTRLWPDGAPPLELKLVETKAYTSGLVLLRYRPDNRKNG